MGLTTDWTDGHGFHGWEYGSKISMESESSVVRCGAMKHVALKKRLGIWRDLHMRPGSKVSVKSV